MLSNDNNLTWKLEKEQHVIQDEWIDFRKNVYKLPDGQSIGPVYNFSKHSFSLVVATDTEGRFICVRQYRHGIDAVTTEFPAGGIEYSKKETPYITKDNIIATEEEAFQAAKRELIEETGYASDNWKHLMTIPSNATISNSNVHIYAATDCKLVARQELDATEFLNVLLIDEAELCDLIKNGDFKQALHVLAYYFFKNAT